MLNRFTNISRASLIVRKVFKPQRVVALSVDVPKGEQKPNNIDKKEVDSTEVAHKMFSSAYFQDLLSKNQTGVMVVGSIAGVVGMSSALYSVGDYLMNLTSVSALYYGFSVGALATTCTAAGAYIVDRSFRIEPESAVRLAIAEVKKNKDLLNTLGHKIHASDVRTYAVSSSGFGIIGAVPRLIHPKVHIAFTLAGSTSPAIVSAVCIKKGLFQYKCEYVGVDWTTPAGATLSLTVLGEESNFAVKTAVRDHVKLLTSKSPKYR